MAITRAQQAKQMLRKGGRIGLRGGGADMSTVSAADLDIGTSTDKRDYSPSEVREQKATQRLNERIEKNRQERERQKLKQELLMTPVGRNRPLGPLSLFNANFQRNMNIKLAKKRYDDLISRLDDYVVGDTDMDYDFSGAPVGLATLTSNKGTSAESTRPNLYTVNPKTSVSALQTLLSATRPDTQVTLQNTLDKAKDYRNLVADAENMTNQEIKDALTELQNRGKTPDQINPVRDNDGPEPIIPVDTTFAETPVDEEDYYASVGGNPFTGEGLRLAFRADGGRIGLQEGGGIEQRLEKLGGDVTSAEKLLQGINKRLETAESSLGSGGGASIANYAPQLPAGGLGTLESISGIKLPQPDNPLLRPGSAAQPAPFIGRPIQLPGIRPDFSATIDPNFKPVEELKAVQPGDPGYRAPGPTTLNGVVIDNFNTNNPFPSVEEAFANAQREAQKTRAGGFFGQIVLPGEMSFEDFSNMFTRFNNFGRPMQLPQGPNFGGQGGLDRPLSGIPAAGYADGGNVVGGEYDFESARQMYGLGKLVKKVTRTVKKIAKSPVGKAAILGLGAYYAPGFGIKAQGGLAPFLQSAKTSIGNFFLGMPGDTTGRVAGTGLLSKIGPLGAIAGVSALAGLLTAKQEEEAQELSRGEGIDIEAARRSILARAQGNVAGDLRATAFLAEGGKPEPVAKKTMPLLDMGGQEMDLRAEGGFVPIGRMEKADDVPARLSKNEFVFTADAVRNAGDGDVDKGAEVMYNMMKNLEAGGEVSEESQGLQGARKMFQTSQRLEEVL